MKRILLLCTVVLIAVPTDTDACTAFGANSEMGYVVGKNFDWQVGSGWIVINRRGIERKPLFSSPTNDESWIAEYGSVSFSPIGPGFPISGMNEKGLVVEGLQHADYRGDLAPIDGFTAFEWAQYLLDHFETVDDVRRFAEATRYFQFALPIHFLVCDATQACLVVESEDKLTTISGKDLKTPVLANRSWHKDFWAGRKKKETSWFDKVTAWFSGGKARYASISRFAILDKALIQNRVLGEEELFEMLDASRIRSLTKWQIIWYQGLRSVTWRHFNGNRPSRLHRIDFDALSFDCDRGEVLVTKTAPDGDVHFESCDDDCRTNTRQRTERILRFLGQDASPRFLEKLMAISAAGGCHSIH